MNHRPLSLLPLLLAAPLLAQGEIDLRPTVKKGNSVWLQVEQKLEQVIDMGGQEMEQTQNLTRVLHVEIKDVDDQGNMTVATKIARVHGSMSLPMGMGDIDFDSAAPDDGGDAGGMPGMGNMKEAMLAGAGKSFTAKLNARGQVVEITEGADAILKGNQGGLNSGNAMDRATLEQIVESAFGTLPEKPVAVGSKWQHTEKETSGRMPMEHKVELTLTKADDQAFEVTASGTVEKPEVAGAGDEQAGNTQEEMARQMLKTMKVKNGKLSGTTRISRKDGFVLDANNSVSMDVEMEAGPMGDMAMAMKQTISTKRTGPEAAEAKKPAAPKDEAKDAGAGKEPVKEAKEGGK